MIHTQEPPLPEPELTTPGRCICCRQNVRYRSRLDDSWPLRQLIDTASDIRARLNKATEHLDKLKKRGEPIVTGEKGKYNTTVKAVGWTLEQARPSARRLLLRHIRKAEVTGTESLSEKEQKLLREDGPPCSLCASCHTWHSLNGYAATQGVMVWLPDLHPPMVAALNRRSLQEVSGNSKFRVRWRREAFSALMQNEPAVENKFYSFHPVDFADIFRRYPPSGRPLLREKVSGIVLTLTPDSFIKKEYVD